MLSEWKKSALNGVILTLYALDLTRPFCNLRQTACNTQGRVSNGPRAITSHHFQMVRVDIFPLVVLENRKKVVPLLISKLRISLSRSWARSLAPQFWPCRLGPQLEPAVWPRNLAPLSGPQLAFIPAPR